MSREQPIGNPPDVESVLSRLKGFQRRTVDYAFERLYLDPDSSRRFLVADEVGLGKTLVARGVIARAIEHLWKTIDRIDIVYICSNSQIAAQNLNRLRITEQEFARADRLTLLPASMGDLDKNKVNYLAFTPGTSFDLRSSLGRWDERVLLYWLVQEVWPQKGTGAKNLFQGGVKNTKWFRRQLKEFSASQQFDPKLRDRFAKRLEIAAKEKGLRKDYLDLCDRFSYARKHIPLKDREDQRRLIWRLRSMLAKLCVQALEPDLVILDEFQRFKHLLVEDPVDEAASLAKELFEYSDEHTDVRVLLLSATPYKMYTLHHERDEDDHYEDFLKTVGFLEPRTQEAGSFESLLHEYRRELYRLGDGGGPDNLARCKARLERRLRRVICRTERIRSSEGQDGMLRELPASAVELHASDVSAYCSLEEIGETVAQPRVIDYWKSAPYLLNFMDDYKIKREVESKVTDSEVGPRIARILEETEDVLLPWEDLRAYREVDPGNARLRHFIHWLEELQLWRLLWLPPALPYYEMDEVFERARKSGLSKRLVFSTWAVVPKTLASLLSYHVEQRIWPAFDKALGDQTVNTPEDRKTIKPLLQFAKSDKGEGRLTGMPLLGILYPSPVLAELGDPITLRRLASTDAQPSLEATLKAAEDRLRGPLARVVERFAKKENIDQQWFWAAPILLDLQAEPGKAKEWLEQPEVAVEWSGERKDEDRESRWADHVAHAAGLTEGRLSLGQPPAELEQVVALTALAGPAVSALRSLTRHHTHRNGLWSADARSAAGTVAWALRSLFNQPETMAMLRTAYAQSELPYWRQVLDYSARGGIQAVLDEYAHVLLDLEGLFDLEPVESSRKLATAMSKALTLRVGVPRVDEVSLHGTRPQVRFKDHRMRNHFAIRFGTHETDDGAKGAREGDVRAAFNSPFWPFVLATTSMGQEGLDFHAYCHTVVHWNLPSNPVDLEQREGRVHRYKGHAIRKNVAAGFGADAFVETTPDAWSSVFEIAQRRTEATDHGLKPFWVFSTPEGAAIERIVPALPLSRDAYQLEALRRSLAVYRMVFGQPRQDDLMAYLLDKLSEERLKELRPLLRIDLFPPRGSTTVHRE